jgi:glyoxylase I family protein
MRFSHVALNCADQAVTERFYTTHFGFRRARVVELGDSQIIFLRNDGIYLELFAASDVRPTGTPDADGDPFVGCRHLAFQVDDVDASLAAMGDDAVISLGPLRFDSVIPGWRSVWLRDPDGTVVEISQGFRDDPALD